MPEAEQQFLNDLDKRLWRMADRLRSNLDAAVYKHAVLGLIFVKYVSDSFEDRQREIEAQLRDLEHDYYADPADFGGLGHTSPLQSARYLQRDVMMHPHEVNALLERVRQAS